MLTALQRTLSRPFTHLLVVDPKRENIYKSFRLNSLKDSK